MDIQMTPIYWNSSSNNYSTYPSDLHNENHLSKHQFLSPNSQASSSSNSLTTHLFLNSTVHGQDGIFHRELQPPQHQHKGDKFGSRAYDDHRIENNDEKDLKFSTWKSEINNMNIDQIQVKWMSSKMRVMLKMKKSDPMKLITFSSTTRQVTELEDHKQPTSPMEETDNSGNSTSSNNNSNMPIRVCSDCNTTKTPLWRSGPQGPKSLCNACGIRQRKARRAMAAAAAAAAENGNTTNLSVDQSIMAPLRVTKTEFKDHKKPSNGHVTTYRKRKYSKQITATMPSPSPYPSPSPSPSPSSASPERKNCVEEFLVSSSKDLAFYRVFPQDEKEAAILLMALSCGYARES